MLPGFHSSVKLVVFTVFYGDHLISYWTAAVYGSHCCNGTSSANFGSECDVVLCVCQIKNDGCDVCVTLTCLPVQSPPDSHLVTKGTRARRPLSCRWSTWQDGSAAAPLSCRAPRAQCADRWAWLRWHTRSRHPPLMKSAWRAKCLCSEWTWTCRSFIVRTGNRLISVFWSSAECTLNTYNAYFLKYVKHQPSCFFNEPLAEDPTRWWI